MYKKLMISCFLITAFLFGAVLQAHAAETANIKDYLNVLTEEQVAVLQGTADSIRSTYDLEPVIVITDNVEGKSSMAYADDYYDYNGYGIGDDKSGLLLLINMADREAWISTTGRAIDIYTDNRISSMLDGVVGNLPDRNFDGAATSFLTDVETYALQGVPTGQYRTEREAPYRGTYWERAAALMKSPWMIIVPLLISIGATVLITMSNKGRVTVTAQTYEEKGSFAVTREVNDFVREHLSRVKIEKSSGSSTHIGGSGTSHGGGGRGF